MSEKRASMAGTGLELAKYWATEKLRRPTEVIGTVALISVTAVATLAGAEPKPLVDKQGEVATDVVRDPVIERIDPDKFMSYALMYSDVSTKATLKKSVQVSDSVPGSEIINGVLKVGDQEYSVTFNPDSPPDQNPDSKVENGLLLSLGMQGAGERVLDLDAPRHTADGESSRPVVRVKIGGLSTRLIDSGTSDGNRYASSGNWGTLPQSLADAVRGVGEDTTTKSAYIEDTLKIVSKGLAYEVTVGECLNKENDASLISNETVEGSIKELEVANFVSMRPEEPPITEKDVVVEIADVDVHAEGVDNFERTQAEFEEKMSKEGFNVTRTDKFKGGEESKCKVSPNLKRINDKGESVSSEEEGR